MCCMDSRFTIINTYLVGEAWLYRIIPPIKVAIRTVGKYQIFNGIIFPPNLEEYWDTYHQTVGK